jgi:predicted component of viral defense system (DUF524 family)
MFNRKKFMQEIWKNRSYEEKMNIINKFWNGRTENSAKKTAEGLRQYYSNPENRRTASERFKKLYL